MLGMIYNLKTIKQHKAKFSIGLHALLFLYFCSVLWTHLLLSQLIKILKQFGNDM